MGYRVPIAVLAESFAHFRRCGAARRECQVLWVSPWASAQVISEVVHPKHRSHGDGFELDPNWLNAFWMKLADCNCGIRAQIHTHPRDAFHSRTDDTWPIVHTPGFLSLVIPNFGMGGVNLAGAFLAELNTEGVFREVSIARHLVII